MHLPWKHFRELTTDGAPSMTSESAGLVGLVKKRLAEMGCIGTFYKFTLHYSSRSISCSSCIYATFDENCCEDS